MATNLMDTPATGTSGLATKAPRRDLFEGVQTVDKAVAARSSLPILTHVLIGQDEKTGRVRITGTDLEMWIEHTLPMHQTSLAIGGGAATAPSKNLVGLLAAMPEADVELTTEAGAGEDSPRTLHLRCNRANYKLLGLAPDEFPLLPQVAENTKISVAPGVLADAIKQVIFAVSTDESRPTLTGVLLSYKGGELRLVATDTHRLAVRDVAILSGSGADAHVVVPARAMSEAQRLVSGMSSGAVTVTISDNQVQFQVSASAEEGSASTTLISRLIEGAFPSYERVIPQTYERKLSIERDALLSALRRASIVAREGSANRVVLRTAESETDPFRNDRLVITATSGNLGNALEEVEIAESGGEGQAEIAFNAKYLIDVLSVLEGDGLHLELTEPLRPGVIRPSEDGNYFCVLMPMQVV
jgi:DNA polymerase-3 subunit beta